MTEPAESSPHNPSNDVGHEARDVRIAPIVASGAALAGGVAACLLLLAWLLTGWQGAADRADTAPSPLTGSQTPPTPRLQPQPREALRTYQQQAERELNAYRWVDRERGVVQLPIDRAIDLLAERGFPPPKPAATATSTRPAAAGNKESSR